MEASSAAFPFLAAATTTAARDGSASLEISPGAYWVRASRGGAACFPVPILSDSPEATLVLESARALRGVVLEPEGAPACGWPVALSFSHADRSVHLSGKTDEHGVFDLPAVPDAWLDGLLAEVAGAFRFEFRREDLLAGTITLQLTAVRLLARVVDEAGVPVERATILLAPASAPEPPSFHWVATTDEDGRFDAVVQRVQGEAFVIAAAGYARLVWRPEASAADRKLHVPEIVLRRGVPLVGRVTDPAGRAIANAAVRLESPRLRGRIVEQGMTDAKGRFRFEGIADEEHVLYAFRPVDPDLCLPQLRVEGVRGGPDDVRVVLPEPIYGAVRFIAQGTGDAVTVEHLTLIVKDARGAEVAKRTWPPGLGLGAVRFELWEGGTYALEVYTAHHEPACVAGVNVVRGRGPEVSVPLVPRR